MSQCDKSVPALSKLALDDFLGKLQFDEKGLIPVITQSILDNRVLMFAHMNAESLCITAKERKACYWSRSRQELWRKGDTSGNYQEVHELWLDCDADVLLLKVKELGPACHTGAETCFFEELDWDSVPS